MDNQRTNQQTTQQKNNGQPLDNTTKNQWTSNGLEEWSLFCCWSWLFWLRAKEARWWFSLLFMAAATRIFKAFPIKPQFSEFSNLVDKIFQLTECNRISWYLICIWYLIAPRNIDKRKHTWAWDTKLNFLCCKQNNSDFKTIIEGHVVKIDQLAVFVLYSFFSLNSSI